MCACGVSAGETWCGATCGRGKSSARRRTPVSQPLVMARQAVRHLGRTGAAAPASGRGTGVSGRERPTGPRPSGRGPVGDGAAWADVGSRVAVDAALEVRVDELAVRDREVHVVA